MTSYYENKTSVLGAIILLSVACAFSVSAQSATQSPRASNNFSAKSTPLAKSIVAAEQQKAESAADTEPMTGPAALSAEAADPINTKRAPASPQTGSADKWQFQVTPYFWLESLHGNAGLGNRSTHVDQSFGDLFHDLDFFIMGAFEARKGKLISLTTLEYTDISDEKATPGPLFSNVKANFKQFIFDSEAGYRVFDNPDKGASIDVLGGARVWHVSTDLAFGARVLPAVDLQGTRNWVDAVAGLRGKAAVSKKMFVTGKFDLGGGGSKFTYQIFGGAGYNLNPKVALIGGYRVLDVNYNKNNFIYDMNQRGPIFGLGFKF